MPPSSPLIVVLPCMAATWIGTLVVVMRYLIARRALDKIDAHGLPEVLRALTPLINGAAQRLTHAATGLSALMESDEEPRSTPAEQADETTAEPGQEVS